jgi:hypothetical protein
MRRVGMTAVSSMKYNCRAGIPKAGALLELSSHPTIRYGDDLTATAQSKIT